MMAVHARYTRFLLDEFDFSGDTNSVEVAIGVDKLETTALQDGAKTYTVGLPDGSISQAGYLEVGTDSAEEEFEARLGTGTAYVAALFGTNVTACPAYVIPATDTHNININANTGALMMMNSEWQHSGGAIRRGIRAFTGTVSATGGQTSIDLGEIGGSGGVAYFFIQDITGSATSATIDVESSSDDVSFASNGTATFSAVGAQAVTLSGTVNRHIRANVTSLGGATDFTFVMIVCVSGVTY